MVFPPAGAGLTRIYEAGLERREERGERADLVRVEVLQLNPGRGGLLGLDVGLVRVIWFIEAEEYGISVLNRILLH